MLNMQNYVYIGNCLGSPPTMSYIDQCGVIVTHNELCKV